MAIPSGGGSEVLKRATLHGVNGANTLLINGSDADTIRIVTSLIICEQGVAAETVDVFVSIGGTAISNPPTDASVRFLLKAQAIGANETFVFNDRFVLEGLDDLYVWNSSGNVDYYCTYIEQDWT